MDINGCRELRCKCRVPPLEGFFSDVSTERALKSNASGPTSPLGVGTEGPNKEEFDPFGPHQLDSAHIGDLTWSCYFDQAGLGWQGILQACTNSTQLGCKKILRYACCLQVASSCLGGPCPSPVLHGEVVTQQPSVVAVSLHRSFGSAKKRGLGERDHASEP